MDCETSASQKSGSGVKVVMHRMEWEKCHQGGPNRYINRWISLHRECFGTRVWEQWFRAGVTELETSLLPSTGENFSGIQISFRQCEQ